MRYKLPDNKVPFPSLPSSPPWRAGQIFRPRAADNGYNGEGEGVKVGERVKPNCIVVGQPSSTRIPERKRDSCADFPSSRRIARVLVLISPPLRSLSCRGTIGNEINEFDLTRCVWIWGKEGLEIRRRNKREPFIDQPERLTSPDIVPNFLLKT